MPGDEARLVGHSAAHYSGLARTGDHHRNLRPDRTLFLGEDMARVQGAPSGEHHLPRRFVLPGTALVRAVVVCLNKPRPFPAMNPDPLAPFFDQLPGLVLRQTLSLLWQLCTSWPGVCLLLVLTVKWLHGVYHNFLRQVERADRPSRRRRW